MARVKKEVVKKKVEVKPEVDTRGIKEESEKGELFFKIVLIVMAVALFGVITYFVVDAIIGNNQTAPSKRYEDSNYVTVADVNRIKNGENFENISHKGLRHALDNYAYVYVLYYADTEDALTDSQKDRQNLALEVADDLVGLDTVETKTFDGFEYFVIADDIAIFFLDTSDAANADWQASIDTSAGQAASANVPSLLEVFNGEDLNFFGPWNAAGKNEAALDKLTEVLEGLN